MSHLARFAAGAIAGIIAMKLIKEKSAKEALEKAQDKLREATVSGLQTIESASARAREHLTEKTDPTAKKAGARHQADKRRKIQTDKESSS